MTDDQFEKLLYDAAAASDDVREFVLLGRQLYALALSMLPAHEREATRAPTQSLRPKALAGATSLRHTSAKPLLMHKQEHYRL